jgi:hypothetical protein
MSIQEHAFASTADDRPGIDSDPGDAWGARADGAIAPAFDYMDEDLEEAMTAIGGTDAPFGPTEGTIGPD